MTRSRDILATAVPALAILVVVAIPTKASGHVAYDGFYRFMHQVHSRNINFYNGVNNSTRRDSTRRAQLTWHNKMNGSLRYYSTSHDSSVVHAKEENHGPTGWSGRALWWGYHRGHGHLNLNTFYSLSATQWQSVACQELGHFSGLFHGLGATDCMSDSRTSFPTHIADVHRDQLRGAWTAWIH